MVSSFVTAESYVMSFPFYDRIEESEWLRDSLNLDFSSPGYSKGVQSQHGPLG